MTKQSYTVVGYAIIDYAPDDWIQYQGYCEQILADDSHQAAERVSTQVIKRENSEKVAGIETVTCAVLSGHHENLPFDP